jgi:hypothetical protein
VKVYDSRVNYCEQVCRWYVLFPIRCEQIVILSLSLPWRRSQLQRIQFVSGDVFNFITMMAGKLLGKPGLCGMVIGALTNLLLWRRES